MAADYDETSIESRFVGYSGERFSGQQNLENKYRKVIDHDEEESFVVDEILVELSGRGGGGDDSVESWRARKRE
jgi:hypothetical protein